jgi:hypothetical protein
MALLIPFLSINVYLRRIVVLPGEVTIDTVEQAKTRLWASLFGITFIGFPAAKFVSIEGTLVENVLESYDNHCIIYFTIFILFIGFTAGAMARKPSSGAKAAAIGLLACAWLGAYLTPKTISLSLEASRLSRAQISDLTSSLMISQFLGGVAAALLSGAMGAIGGALVWQRKNADLDSYILYRPRVYTLNGSGSFFTKDTCPRNRDPRSIWSIYPHDLRKLIEMAIQSKDFPKAMDMANEVILPRNKQKYRKRA